MNSFATFIVIIGILILSIPILENRAVKMEQKGLLNRLETEGADSVTTDRQVEERYEQLNAILDEGQQREESTKQTKEAARLLGKIEIPSIDIELPILDGANMENLDIAVGRLKGTGVIGKNGNMALAAHRSYKYGKLFNRLDEVEVGDGLQIDTGGNTYEYEVKDTFRVVPTDLSVLKDTNQESIVTLITCDPIHNPTHRLIVQAEMKDKSDALGTEASPRGPER